MALTLDPASIVPVPPWELSKKRYLNSGPKTKRMDRKLQMM
ncbi:hypothetical protein RJ639_023414 [Escallonia herrerae]|uniref:Uncharacterized protein n=1 Tax=Escallonia herrerae TaxID=1293975 RepID=A0AA89AE68_9ASTE|nr:hypothetical protein RJ639_023414 [Escallonia herrerae]